MLYTLGVVMNKFKCEDPKSKRFVTQVPDLN